MTKPLVTPTPENIRKKAAQCGNNDPEVGFLLMFGYHLHSDEEAINAGHLHHLWPETWPWLLVTNTVLAECEAKAAERDEYDAHGKPHTETVLIPLVTDCILETQRQSKLNPRCDLVELEHTALGTVWVRPNSKGGMTVMKPEDN